ncbi:hypothetical protein K469DRAFT_644356 [Zopfia rhizophila CBS 207.26]|uniref:polynucleotide adenylyltransferase n=1 Tax=Zopfia rhizophila CBS 207.26 TaxID=1314779 RepID=A0A6A6DIE4_9PEZI|nr:hypothetical protein K469DRAFT_644356 [Zopfia rhizophila CBS 207.26]
MAGTDETSLPPSFAINSYETAICVIPPAGECQNIDQLRSLYDKGYGKWPSHINLIYPFVAPESLPRARELIQSKLAETHSESQERTQRVCLDSSGYFTHETTNTIYLCESKGLASSAFPYFRSLALQCLGHEPEPCNFHLTIGQSEGLTESSRGFLLRKANLLPRLEFQIQSLAILIRERIPGQHKSANRMRIWGIINVPGSTDFKPSPLSEFWIKSDQKEDVSEEEDTNDTEVSDDSKESTVTLPFSREVQPGKTYHFCPETGLWTSSSTYPDNEIMPTTLTISSYNVLVDSEYPPARDSNPLLLTAILSRSALADIIILQEVSDDFLSYLLANAEIRQLYPYTSHGPPNQPGIGPLPSLRNVVILSILPFTWVLLPFHRRHKGAVVAQFDTISKTGGSKSVPLVVSGIHLTCGLTDGSVAAKKMQLQNLKNYLSRNFPSNPWVVAGDFNVTTSTYTIDTALRNKSISQQTSKTLTSIEDILAEAGLLDAWSVARVEATHDSASGVQRLDSDDLYEGEDGATFNPRENELAAATSGTSNNRPQRYDRILVKPEGLLYVNQFNLFGFSQDHNGMPVLPSDHWGIKATMKVYADATGKISGNLDVLKQYPLHLKQASPDISNVSALTWSLSEHQMFPTEEEIQGRKEAFTLIKVVLLGSSDDDDASTSDIPMVIIPVGSYAMGVWTSSSDIDCLCIGSISSKTFFKLARQRIRNGGGLGVRLLRKVEANTGTMLELSVNGVNMDLQYCPAARIIERWSELPTLPSTDAIYNLPMLSLRKLKPYRDISYIQRTLPSLPTFRLAYRCIRLWAIKRGIYSSKFGYLGGIHITLMLSWICKRVAHQVGSVTATDLVTTFFHHYGNFDWKNDMLFDPFFHKDRLRYQRAAREPMVILGFHAPNANVAHTSSIPGLNILVKEFKLANRHLSVNGMTWAKFLGEPENEKARQLSASAKEFLNSYESYVRIDMQYWGRSLGKGKGLVGWLESRCLLLVVDINKAFPDLEIRIWPARFTERKAADAESDYHGCYLIGLSKGESMEFPASKEDKLASKNKLQKILTRFQTQLQSDEKYYNPSSSYIGVELVKQGEVKSFQLDTREWGDYVPDFEDDSDDEDAPDEPDDALGDPPTTYKLPIRPGPPSPSTSIPVSTNKLRPASDVLNRLRWDPNLDPLDYIVGYEDRFLGAKETTLENWKTEQTDDEFIPQHRILYFKRRGDGVVVWERARRIDAIFGSGVGAGS